MFGLFGKSDFDSEMDKLDKEAKTIGVELSRAMGSFDLAKQAELLLRMAKNCDDKAQCCRKHGKTAEAQKWLAAKEKALQLRG